MNTSLTISGNTEMFGVNVPKLYGGFGDSQKVMLVKTIAEIHGKETKHINELINNNRGRFIDNEHIIDVKNSVVATDPLLESGILSKQSMANSANIYILSERGYLRLLKIMDDEVAWQRFDVVEKDYFGLKENALTSIAISQAETDAITKKYALDMSLMANKYAIEMLKIPQTSQIRMLTTVYKNFGIATNTLPSYTEERVTRSATDLLKLNGSPMSAQAFNKLLVFAGLAEEKTRPSSRGGTKKFKSLTDNGMEYGKNLLSTVNDKETQIHLYEAMFPELLKVIA